MFLENPFLIMAFCTILCQSYILVPFLNVFYAPLYNILTSLKGQGIALNNGPLVADLLSGKSFSEMTDNLEQVSANKAADLR